MNTLRLSLVVVVSSSFLACGGEPAKAPTNETTGAPSSTPAATPTAAAAAAVASAPEKSGAAAPSAPPAPKVEEPITSVRVYLSNKCAQKVEYCVEDGSTLNTFLGGNSSTTHTVKPGAKFRVKSGSSCGNTVYTAPPSRDEVKASICEK